MTAREKRSHLLDKVIAAQKEWERAIDYTDNVRTLLAKAIRSEACARVAVQKLRALAKMHPLVAQPVITRFNRMTRKDARN
jgi:hypothetical protein